MTSFLGRATESLQAARLLSAGGFHAGAVSRSYYAVFYAARELLLEAGVSAKTHRGVASEFSRLFVATGRLGAPAAYPLRRLQEERTLADYQDGDVTDAQARAAIAAAQSFLHHVAGLADEADSDSLEEPMSIQVTLTPDQRRDLVAQLRREMEEASEALEFERAAELRDSISQIEATLAA